MCGRFTHRFTWRELVELYRITEPYIAPISHLQPRFNFAPMQRGIVVRPDKEGHREPVMMRWGLVPTWAKDDSGAARCINAKAETVAEKPMFRGAFKARPCLVPADGFYEWAPVGAVGKQPYFITTKPGEPFAFAGLWEWWRAKGAAADAPGLETFTILTTEPNALCAPIHNRMPVMLAQDDWPRWLGTSEDRRALLAHASFPAERMECWPVGKGVGNVRNEGPELVERIAA
ncbi:MAG TPA: SOS response-associated peptidase [Rhizomicrobium sp.]|jgi:putative SOS response-associated peptidase YedK|nr:SOS response-associated peptidase [Rhizomicrobium sp.]